MTDKAKQRGTHPNVNQAYDGSEDVEFFEAAEETTNTGRRGSDSSKVKGDVQARGQQQLRDDLQLESTAQTAGSRSPNVTSEQGKQDTNSKTRTSEAIPKRSNPVTHSDYGAAEKRRGGQAEGITTHTVSEEDERQKKVVSERNDANAGGARTGERKAS
jgi:hypothetical protein